MIAHSSPLFLVKAIFLFGFGIMLTALQNKLVSMISTNNPNWENKVAPLLSAKVSDKV